MTPPYTPLNDSRSQWLMVRGVQYHVRTWGSPASIQPDRPARVLLHGWMDVAASFQFLVDALRRQGDTDSFVIAPDWRGFGWTHTGRTDTYWYADYLADLDHLLRAPELGLSEAQPVDLVGHSMGGNIAMIYAGARPERIRRLVNLEGFGLPATTPDQAPSRYRQWLDELRHPAQLRPYLKLEDVAARLRKNNPRLPQDRALWLAAHWSRRDEDGRWHLLADAAHKHISPSLYRRDEVLACWRAITAPVLWVDGEQSSLLPEWGSRYPSTELDERLSHVPHLQRVRLPDCGHMLHHDQPESLARHVRAHLA